MGEAEGSHSNRGCEWGNNQVWVDGPTRAKPSHLGSVAAMAQLESSVGVVPPPSWNCEHLHNDESAYRRL